MQLTMMIPPRVDQRWALARQMGVTRAAMSGDPVQAGAVEGINVGYEASGMIYTVGYVKGLMQASGIAWD